MKSIKNQITSAFFISFLAASCGDNARNPVEVGGNGGGAAESATGAGGGSSGTGGVKELLDVSGDVTTNTTWSHVNDYLMKGVIFVKAGATLTIEAGTTIKGDPESRAVLVVQPGAKLVAQGTASEPIVFTSLAEEGSKKAGDWGGVIVLGKAPVNVPGGQPAIEGLTSGGTYGGSDPDDSSGVISYVRVEYSGVLLSPNNEVNGLTFGGVGRGTKLDHVQVRHTLDDCFEFFGGTVNGKYLACQYNQDDGLDWDFGYTGKVQFFVLQQDPSVADDTNGFEGDNDALGSNNAPFTSPTVYNATLCGHGVEVPKNQYGMLLRRNVKAHIFNTVAVGFEAGIEIRDEKTGISAANGDLQVRNSIFFGSVGAGVVDHIAAPEPKDALCTCSGDPVDASVCDKSCDADLDELAWIETASFKNSFADPKIPGCFDAGSPKFGPAVSLTANAATPPDDGFFDASATYIGAFKDGADDWATAGNWALWSAD